MNTPIVKRSLITHSLRWYWKVPALRKQIREISEDCRQDPPEGYVQLPMISQDDIFKVIASEPTSLKSQILAECSLEELHDLYRAVFFNSDDHRIHVTMSPLTDKLGRHILPYTGVMAVFCLADLLMKSEITSTFTETELMRLGWLRWMSARRLHTFTKRLTRINADSNPTYGVCVNDGDAQIYLVETGRPSKKEIDIACRTYTGKLPTLWREAKVTPTSIQFHTVETLTSQT